MSEYLVIDNLAKVYPTPKGPAIIVKDFNLRIKKGEFVCLIGHSGCGKSTVLSMLAGLNEISGGAVVFSRHEIIGAAPRRGGVFLSPWLLPRLSAFEKMVVCLDQVVYIRGTND